LDETAIDIDNKLRCGHGLSPFLLLDGAQGGSHFVEG
jgi:hypothetical protein